MKIAKATITALLYTSKTLANGEHPVMIRVCYNGKRKYPKYYPFVSREEKMGVNIKYSAI